ncbi:hypothetical protein RYX36_008667 [Vicia faba]
MSRNSLTFQDIFHFSISLTLETLHSYHFFTSHLLFLSLTLFTCAYYSPFFSISKVCSNIRHGPKRLVTSKKPKTAEVESSRVQEPFDRIKFLGLEQQDRYDELIGRSIWSKRIF